MNKDTNSKLSIKNFVTSPLDKISLDVGNGIYKLGWVTQNGIQTDSTINMVSNFVDYSGVSDKDYLEYNGKQYLVGKDAETGDIIANNSFEYHIDNGPLLLYKLLKDNGLVGKTRTKTLLLGVALHDYTPQNILNIIKRFKKFTVGKDTIEFKYVLVTVQSVGSLKYYASQNDNYVPEKSLIIDIGTYTIMIFKYFNGEIINMNKILPDSGIIWLLKKWYEYIKNKYPNSTITIPQLNLLWQKSLKYREDDIKKGINFFNRDELVTSKESKFMNKLFFYETFRPDVSEFLYDLEKSYVYDYVVKTVLANVKSEMGESELVLFVGGTLNLLKYYNIDKLKPNFKFCPPPYELSNVQGLLYHNFVEINNKNVVGIYKSQLNNVDLNKINIK